MKRTSNRHKRDRRDQIEVHPEGGPLAKSHRRRRTPREHAGHEKDEKRQQNLDPNAIANFHTDVGKMGYKFQFVTLAGWHLLNLNAFDLAKSYREEGMTAYVRLQQEEFKREKDGYTAVKHQREAGAEYFDKLLAVILGERSSTSAVVGSTEKEQFK